MDSVEMHPTISYTTGLALYNDMPTVFVDIKNGILDLQIGNFEITVTGIEINDIEVPVYSS